MARYSTKLKPKQPQKKSMLPLWLALAGLALVVVAGLAFWNNSSQPKASLEFSGGPRLKVDNEVIDHGNVKLGTTIVDEVRVTNVGDQPLKFVEAPLVSVKEGC